MYSLQISVMTFLKYRGSSPIAAKWRSIGIALRLNPHILDTVQADNDDSAACLRSVITEWLKRNYKLEKFGGPTWKQLVDAVRDPAGGVNVALAREIARRHKAQGMLSSLLMLGIFH